MSSSRNLIRCLDYASGALFTAIIVLLIYQYPKRDGVPRLLNRKQLMDLPVRDVVDRLRRTELDRMKNVTYLDYAGLTPFPASVIRNFSTILHTKLFGNTHSASPSAELSTTISDDVRAWVRKYFHATPVEYSVIFTYSTWQSIKLINEALPANGSRASLGVPIGGEPFLPTKGDASFEAAANFSNPLKLVAFRAVDGAGWALGDDEIASIFRRWPDGAIVADLDGYMSQRQLSLKKFPFAGVAFSFRTWFGYPNIAVLVLRNSLVPLLERPYFGGGTLVYALPYDNFERMRMIPYARFEDGSLPFLAIAAVQAGVEFWELIGAERLSDNLRRLSSELVEGLRGIPGVSLGATGVHVEFAIHGHTAEDIVLAAEASGIILGRRGSYVLASLGWGSSSADVKRLVAWLKAL